MVLLCILGDGNSFGGDFLSEDMRPEINPQRIIEPSERTWCVRVCVYWRTSCVYACTYVCMCVRSHACMYVRTYVRSLMYMRTCMRAWVHILMCVCVCVYVHAWRVYVRAMCTWYVHVCRRACLQASKKLKSWRKSTEMVHPHVVLKSFPLLTVHVKLYI